MEILGLALGITICAVAWCTDAIREQKKLATLQDEINAEVEARLQAIEKRRAQTQPIMSTGDQTSATQRVRAGKVPMRTWNEDIGAVGEAQ